MPPTNRMCRFDAPRLRAWARDQRRTQPPHPARLSGRLLTVGQSAILALACQQAKGSDDGSQALRSPVTLAGTSQRGQPGSDSAPTRCPHRSDDRAARVTSATVMPASDAIGLALVAAPCAAAGAEVEEPEQGERAHPTPRRGATAGGRRSYVS